MSKKPSPRFYPRTKNFRTFLLLVSLSLLIEKGTAYAQEEAGSDVFELDPFTVQTDDVQGYIATTAMTATKIGTAIKDTPLNVQVMTAEFLDDAAMLNFEEITSYSSSFSQDAVNGSNFNSVLNAGQRGDTTGPSNISGQGRVGVTPPNGIRLRAFPISNILRNGLPRGGNHTLKGVDRVEVVKGPVAIFFGQSQPGGAINYVTKRPVDIYQYKVKTRVGEDNLRAVELDANAPLLDSLGIRLLGSWQESDDWRQFVNFTEEYLGLVLKWDPTPWLTIVLEGEKIDRTGNSGGSPIVTNPLYHNDFFNPPDEILFLPQDSTYGRNPWNRGFGREDTLRRWQQTILRNRDNWVNARQSAFPEEGYPSVITQYFFDGVKEYENNRQSFEDAAADVYGPDANLSGPNGFTSDVGEVAYYEISVRPYSWLSLKASGNYGENSRKFRMTGVNMPYGDMTLAGTSVNTGQLESKFTNHIFDMVFRFDLFGTPQKIVTGGELRWSETVRWRNDRTWTQELTQIYREWDPRAAYYPPLDEIYPLTSREPDVIGIFEPSDASRAYNRSERLGSYVMHQGEFLNGRLHTMAGIRHENSKEKSRGVLSIDWRDLGTTSGTSQAIGFVYEVTNSVNIYASWNQNYQPNTRFSVEASDLGDFNQQDLNERQWLEDETGTGIDLGLKVEAFDGKLTGQFSYFEIEREGISRLDYQRSLQRMLDEGWTDDSFRVRYYVNGGLERAEGFETEILSTPLPGWQILLSYTYYFDANVVSDPSLADFQAEAVIGQGLPNVSKQRLSLWTNYEIQEGRLEGFSIGGGVRYASASKPFVYNWQYDITNGSYTIYDARLAYKFEALKGNFNLALNVKNVTDKLYSSGGLGFSPPRIWILSLHYSY
ncbi:TonB-dependent receptor [Puniceicoccales bacterium CK1056]|uniref:TonB-dependent receptor n=1 Tax=Oceanipulchritudo coccoides TaxID=2706888 RepID=A0A6B2LYI1_9BACT|nr:TonB-dependent receptor [Oceanipulchritudo coccoides]NDV61731.1 TonB-dependent receptor [Oceanipulchritudo coccoides]